MSKRVIFNLDDITHVFYVPNKSGIIDAVNPITHRGVYSGKSLSELQEENPAIAIGLFDDVIDMNNARTRRPPTPIPMADFLSALEVLPPEDWRSDDRGETFKMPERLSGSITAIYARIGNAYFTLADDYTLTHNAIIELCLNYSRDNA